MRYVSEEHALSVDVSLDDKFENGNEDHDSIKSTPFDVEFQYRHVGSEDETFSNVKASSENGKRFKVSLEDNGHWTMDKGQGQWTKDTGGDLEYRCRYVAKRH